jgi:hypothetical protein
MAMTELLEAARARIRETIQTWGFWARWAWCRKQRRDLSRGGQVVWVRGDAAAAWAEWGARRGYFAVQYMDGLPYLSSLGAPTA